MDHDLTISAGTARVDLRPKIGGRIAQMTVGERTFLKGPEHAVEAGWIGWGSYPLVPWSNRIPGGVIDFEDETWEVPVNHPDGTAIHGLAADTPWRVLEATDTTAMLGVELDVARYQVSSTQRFSIDDGGLDQTITITNRAPWRVPVGTGIHPWFAVGPVAIPADAMWEGEPMPSGPPRPVGPDEDLRTARLAPPMDRCYTALTGTTATIGDLTLSWRGPITQIVVYSGEQEWVCVEPVTMSNDGFHYSAGPDVTGTVLLAEGESLEVSYRFAWPT